MARDDIGTCDSCSSYFSYQLIHNGFNDTAFAYCDRCGCTAFLNGYCKAVPSAAKLTIGGPVNIEAEALLAHCVCGGNFKAGASPRCPHCRAELSGDAAGAYIEGNTPGTAKGWRWQGSWRGPYCIVVENLRVDDPWRLGS
jgi:hypothetical protein